MCPQPSCANPAYKNVLISRKNSHMAISVVVAAFSCARAGNFNFDWSKLSAQSACAPKEWLLIGEVGIVLKQTNLKFISPTRWCRVFCVLREKFCYTFIVVYPFPVQRPFVFIIYLTFALFYRSQKAAACILPNTCLGIGVKILTQLESVQVGGQWKNISDHASIDDNSSLILVITMFLSQSMLWLIITWYVSSIFT